MSSLQQPKLRKSKSASEAKELTPNMEWKCPTKETKSSKQRREMNAGKGERSPRGAVPPDEIPKEANVSEWLRKKHTEQKQEIKELEMNTDLLHKKVTELKTHLNESVQKQKETEEVNQGLTEQKDALTKEKLEIRHRLTEVTETNEKLQNDVKNKNNQNVQLENEKLNLQNGQEKLENDLKSFKEIIELESKDKIVTQKEFEKKLAQIISEKKSLEEEINGELKPAVTDLCDTLKEEKQRNEELKMENERLIKMNNGQKINIEKLNDKHLHNENLINEKIKEYLIIENEVEKLKLDTESKKTFNEELQMKNQNLTKDLQHEKFENEELSEKVNILKTDISQLESSKRKLLSDNELYEKNVVTLKKTLEDVKKNLDDANTKVDLLNQENQNLSVNLIKATEIIETNDNMIKELKETLENTKACLNTTEKDWSSERNDLLAKISDLEEKVSKLSSELDVSNIKLNGQTELLDKLKVDKCENDIRNTKEIERLLTVNENLSTEIKDLKNLSERVTSQLDKNIEKYELVKQKELVQLDEITHLKELSDMLQMNLQQNDQLISELKNKLDNSNVLVKEKQNESDSNRVNLTLAQETNSQLEQKLKNAKEQMNTLNKSNTSLNAEKDELKKTNEDCVVKHANLVEEMEKTHSKSLQKLQDELDMSKIKNKEEINELMNNFGELENELTFCQDELSTKADELVHLKDELNTSNSEYQLQENKLNRELASLNEQNETILQNEISKYKTECDEKLLEFREQSTVDITEIHNEFQAKLTMLKDQYEESKQNELEKVHKTYEDKILLAKLKNDQLESKLKNNEKESEAYDLIMKSKNEDLSKKDKLMEKLSRRVETQQKLIDYVMKSLEQERSKKGYADDEILNMLSDIHIKVNENNNNVISPIAMSPVRRTNSHSSLVSNLTHSEMTFNASPSPTHSPHSKELQNDVFYASTPNHTNLSQSLPWVDHEGRKQQNGSDKLAQSLPESSFRELKNLRKSLTESGFHDLGYDSPDLGNSYHSLYFEDQLRSISQTFQNIETINSNSENEINLEVWKQKIHYRLRVLENQMNQLETGSIVSNQSNRTVTTSTWLTFQKQNKDVVYRPSNDQIRELIDNVNQKYQSLNKMKLFKKLEKQV